MLIKDWREIYYNCFYTLRDEIYYKQEGCAQTVMNEMLFGDFGFVACIDDLC
jgi:hypothetical protein